MGHTYALNYMHCVFSTKERQPLIAGELRRGLYGYLDGIAKGEGFDLIEAGGTIDHVHVLIQLPAAYRLADAMQKLKGGSSKWMGSQFAWQQGYGAFSVSPSKLTVVTEYIRNQEVHHRRRDFEAEFLALLRQCGVEYDARYVLG